MIRKCRGW